MGLMLKYKKYQPKYFNQISGRPFKLKNINKYSQWRKEEYNDNKQVIYEEHDDGFWIEYKYDDNGNMIYTKDSDGYWEKMEYDKYKNMIYVEDSGGAWTKWEFKNKRCLMYMEDSDGYWERWENKQGITRKETSRGGWEEFIVKKGKFVYYKNSYGYTIDKLKNVIL